MIAIRGNKNQDACIPDLCKFFAMLEDEGIDVGIEADFKVYLESKDIMTPFAATLQEVPSDASLVVSIGGDGTFLRTAAWVGGKNIPVMGINTGHLGYLAGFSLREPGPLFAAFRGKYELSSRMTLRVDTEYIPAGIYACALNEIAVSKGDTTSMVEVKAYIDGHYLGNYQADGLIVSTPTGSTAYNLSCGGPILEPTLGCMVLSPIAPHSLTLRPLVIPADCTLQLEVSSRGAQCHVGVDGRTFAVPSSGSVLTLRRSAHDVLVAQPEGTFFSDVLRNKMRWGEQLGEQA